MQEKDIAELNVAISCCAQRKVCIVPLYYSP